MLLCLLAYLLNHLYRYCDSQNRTISPRFLGWSDDASGVHRFEVEVYLLQPGTSGTLQQLADPQISSTVTPELNNFQYIAERPGVYAIVATVYDAAGNSARARKIFTFNDQPGFDETEAPVYFIGSNSNANSFITTIDSEADQLTLSWAGRFVPKNLQLSRRVEPWPTDQNTIDDVYGTTFGARSISADSDAVGVTDISCVYRVVPNSNAGELPDQPELGPEAPQDALAGNCSTDLKKETATLDLASPLKDGDVVMVRLVARDYSGTAEATVKVTATVDVTRPVVSDASFERNRDSKYES